MPASRASRTDRPVRRVGFTELVAAYAQTNGGTARTRLHGTGYAVVEIMQIAMQTHQPDGVVPEVPGPRTRGPGGPSDCR